MSLCCDRILLSIPGRTQSGCPSTEKVRSAPSHTFKQSSYNEGFVYVTIRNRAYNWHAMWVYVLIFVLSKWVVFSLRKTPRPTVTGQKYRLLDTELNFFKYQFIGGGGLNENVFNPLIFLPMTNFGKDTPFIKTM